MPRDTASSYAGRRAVVQHDDGTSIAGTVERWDDRDIALGEAAIVLHEGADPVPLDGLVVVDRMHVKWTQVL